MKVKEINRTANVAWSPSQQYPIYLAAGTAAQQLDATFSTTAALEIFHLDFNNHDINMPLVGALPCEHRFNKLIWGNFGITEGEYTSGVVIGGTDKGDILVVDANKIISGSSEDSVVQSINQHSGPVHGLDINPFQANLLASGGTGSEIYVLDLKNPSTPLAPGNKSLQPDVITCVGWNKTVQHILGTASPGTGKVIVWDLRKNEPVIKVGDASSMMRCKSMAWHPEVATQMVIANEDDRYPVIQMWDLRFATSPMKMFEGHQRGILSLAWCAQDPDLLMSCGKDNRILCFNPNSDIPGGEILYELQTSSQWAFDVLWCPRNPGLISTTSFDGHVTVNSLLGGGTAPHTTQDQVMDAFGGADLGSLPPHLQQQKQQQQHQQQQSEPLKKTPRWMKKPCAARFGFGGKLISFGNFKESPAKQIYISQVVTEEELLRKSITLENALLAGQFVEFCDHKVNMSTDPFEKSLWNFLKVNFDKEPRLKFLDLLGYNPQELSKKICTLTNVPKSPALSLDSAVDAKELASKMELLSATGENSLKADGSLFSSGSVSPSGAGTKTPASDNEGAAVFDAIAATGTIPPVGSADPLANDEGRPPSPLTISTEDDTDGLVSQALLTGNFEAAVDVCFKAHRMADALLLAIAGGPELFTRTQNLYLEHAKSSVSRLISSVVNRDWRSIVETCAIDSWREALAALITYAKAEEFSALCDLMGERLESEDQQFSSAMVCYICGGNVERMVACWSRSVKQEPSALQLQDLVEKLMILKKAVEKDNKDIVNVPDSYLSRQISKYANILASQGCYETAMAYLATVNDPSIAVLKDRVFRAQSTSQACHVAPEPPFARMEILASPAPKPQEDRHRQQLSGQMALTGNPYQSHFPPVQTQSTLMYEPPKPSPNFMQPARPSYQAPAQPGYIASSPVASSQPTQIGGQAIFTPAPPPTSQAQPLFQPVSSQGYGQYNPSIPGSTTLPPPPSVDAFSNSSPTSTVGLNFNPMVPPQPQPQPPTLPNLFNPAAMQNSYSGAPNPQGPPFSQVHPGQMPPPLSQPSPGPPPPGPQIPFSAPDASASGPPPGKFIPGFHHLTRDSPTQPQNLPPGMFVPNKSQPPPEEKKLPPEPAPQDIIKAPIPSEHMIVQEVFNAIVDRCRAAGNNPQTKRKLEEVTRRLEVLYDMLRESKLSPNVLGGLHQMVDACKVGNYPSGLQIYTQMVASGNFSEISTFMSGLKTLMQVASQLRV